MVYLVLIGISALLYGWAVPRAFYGPLKFLGGAWLGCLILYLPIGGIIRLLYNFGFTRLQADEIFAGIAIIGGGVVAGYLAVTLAIGLVLKLLSRLAAAVSSEGT